MHSAVLLTLESHAALSLFLPLSHTLSPFQFILSLSQSASPPPSLSLSLYIHLSPSFSLSHTLSIIQEISLSLHFIDFDNKAEFSVVKFSEKSSELISASKQNNKTLKLLYFKVVRHRKALTQQRTVLQKELMGHC